MQDNLWKHKMKRSLVLPAANKCNLHHGKIRVENPSRPPRMRDGRIRRTLIKFAHHLIVSLHVIAIRHILRENGWNMDEKARKQGFAKTSTSTHAPKYPWIIVNTSTSWRISTHEQTNVEFMQHQHLAAHTLTYTNKFRNCRLLQAFCLLCLRNKCLSMSATHCHIRSAFRHRYRQTAGQDEKDFHVWEVHL